MLFAMQTVTKTVPLVKKQEMCVLFQELKEEFTRILTANNPHAPQNIVRYSFKVREFPDRISFFVFCFAFVFLI